MRRRPLANRRLLLGLERVLGASVKCAERDSGGPWRRFVGAWRPSSRDPSANAQLRTWMAPVILPTSFSA